MLALSRHCRRVLHPNISMETGSVALPLVGRDWRPVLSLNTVLFAIQVRVPARRPAS